MLVMHNFVMQYLLGVEGWRAGGCSVMPLWFETAVDNVLF